MSAQMNLTPKRPTPQWFYRHWLLTSLLTFVVGFAISFGLHRQIVRAVILGVATMVGSWAMALWERRSRP
jgi:hypothetical protein